MTKTIRIDEPRESWREWQDEEHAQRQVRRRVSPGKVSGTMYLPAVPRDRSVPTPHDVQAQSTAARPHLDARAFDASAAFGIERSNEPEGPMLGAGARAVQHLARRADTTPMRAAAQRTWSDSLPVQRKAAAGSTPGELNIEAIGDGEQVPEDVRAKMETALGADFSGVRIHVGAQAASVGALAFTRGLDIFFAPGQYQPHSRSGQELLGHELGHVVQQFEGRVQPSTENGSVPLNDDAALEREADAMGMRAALGTPAQRSADSIQQPARRARTATGRTEGNGVRPLQAKKITALLSEQQVAAALAYNCNYLNLYPYLWDEINLRTCGARGTYKPTKAMVHAIARFQEKHLEGETPDGKLGPRTFKAIMGIDLTRRGPRWVCEESATEVISANHASSDTNARLLPVIEVQRGIIRALAHWTDIDESMTDESYNQQVTSNSARTSKRSFYNVAIRALAIESQRIVQLVAQVKQQANAGTVDQQKLDELSVMQELVQSLTAMYTTIQAAQGYTNKQRSADTSRVVDTIGHAQSSLTKLVETNPNIDVGVSELRKNLDDLTTVAAMFMMAPSGYAASRRLDAFFVQIHQRLRQIQNGQGGSYHKTAYVRRRSNESADLNGALQSYTNDKSDMAIVVKRFTDILSKVGEEGYDSQEAIREKMLAACPQTSPLFKAEVDKLSRAVWNNHIAKQGIRKTNRATQSAQIDIAQGNKNIVAANKRLDEADRFVESSNNFIDTRKIASTDGLDKARSLSEHAKQHVAQAKHLLGKNEQLIAGANVKLQKANDYLAATKEHHKFGLQLISLVENGPYGKPLSQVVGQVKTDSAAVGQGIHNAQTKLNQAESDLETLQKNNEKGYERAAGINKNIASTDERITSETEKAGEERKRIEAAVTQIYKDSIDRYGADKEQIIKTFKGLSASELRVARKLFYDRYGWDLKAAMYRELSGDDLEAALTEINRTIMPELDTRKVDRVKIEHWVKKIYVAIDQLGTKEEVIRQILYAATPEERLVLEQVWQERHGEEKGTLEQAFAGEMKNHELGEMLALLYNDEVGATIVGNRDALGFWNDDEARIEKNMWRLNHKGRALYKKRVPQLVHQMIIRALQDGKDTYDKAEDRNYDANVYVSLYNNDPAMAVAVRADQAMRGAGTNEDRFNNAYEALIKDAKESGLTEAQISDLVKSVEGKYNARMKLIDAQLKSDPDRDGVGLDSKILTFKSAIDEDFSKGEKDLAHAYRVSDLTMVKAAKVRVGVENGWFGDGDEHLWAALAEMYKDRNAQEKFQERYKTDVQSYLKKELSGLDRERAAMLIKTGKLTPAFQIYYAADRYGTLEKLFKDAFKGMGKSDITKLRQEWDSKYAARYGRTFDEMIQRELGGQDLEDVEIMVKYGAKWQDNPDKSGVNDLAQILRRHIEFQRGSGSNGFSRAVMDVADAADLTSSPSRIAKIAAKLKELTDEQGNVRSGKEAELRALFKQAMAVVGSYRAARDQITDAIATGAEIALAAVATVLTEGAASPWLVAALSGVVITGADIAIKKGMKGSSYGTDQLVQDVVKGLLLNTVSAGVGVKVGGVLSKRLAEVERLFGSSFTRRVHYELMQTGVANVMASVSNSVMDEQAWEKGQMMWFLNLSSRLMYDTWSGALGSIAGTTAASTFKVTDVSSMRSFVAQQGVKGFVESLVKTRVNPSTYENGMEEALIGFVKAVLGDTAKGIATGAGSVRKTRKQAYQPAGAEDLSIQQLTNSQVNKLINAWMKQHKISRAKAERDVQSFILIGETLAIDPRGRGVIRTPPKVESDPAKSHSNKGNEAETANPSQSGASEASVPKTQTLEAQIRSLFSGTETKIQYIVINEGKSNQYVSKVVTGPRGGKYYTARSGKSSVVPKPERHRIQTKER